LSQIEILEVCQTQLGCAVSDVPRRSLLNLHCTRCVYGKSAHEFYISNDRHAHLLCTQCDNGSGLIKADRKHLVQSEVHMHAKGTTLQDRHNYTWPLFSLMHPIQRASHLLCQAHGRQGFSRPASSVVVACMPLRPWRAWGRRRMHSQRRRCRKGRTSSRSRKQCSRPTERTHVSTTGQYVRQAVHCKASRCKARTFLPGQVAQPQDGPHEQFSPAGCLGQLQ